MKTSYERAAIEDFLRSLAVYQTAEDDYSYEEQLRYEVAAALEPKKQNRKKQRFLEV